MDKAIEEISKVFNHLAREVQLYLVPGFIILMNIYAINYYYYNSSMLDIAKQQYYWFAIIVLAYVFGHISMALFYVLIELDRFDKKINKLLGLNYKINSSALPNIYNKNKEAYFHFVERYVILSLMRWTMSASLFVVTITDTVYLVLKPLQLQVLILTFASATSSIILFIL